MDISLDEKTGLWGFGKAELFIGRDLVQSLFFENLITELGDQMYAEGGARMASAPPGPTGMHLGTSTTNAASKSGAGAALGAYISGSNVGFQLGYPLSSKPSSARVITYKATFGPGVAQVSNINEGAIVNQTITTNTLAPAANTVCRVKFSSAIDKSNALAQLVLTWNHLILGA